MKSLFAVIALVLFVAPLRAEELSHYNSIFNKSKRWGISSAVFKIPNRSDPCVEVGNFLKSLGGCSEASYSGCMELSVVLENAEGQCIIKSVDENENVPLATPTTIGSLRGINHDRTYLKPFHLSVGNKVPSLWLLVDNIELLKSFDYLEFSSEVNVTDHRRIVFRVLE